MASCTSVIYGALSTVEFSLNAFTEFAELFAITVKGLEPATP